MNTTDNISIQNILIILVIMSCLSLRNVLACTEIRYQEKTSILTTAAFLRSNNHSPSLVRVHRALLSPKLTVSITQMRAAVKRTVTCHGRDQ
ncbi:hypothetical protein CDAR_609411 [Caerostris darwini]|uniref:Antifreeze protein n=1 Tax=Caerostris darwini TaxID=1538125 RepID=A0AAV4VWY0_9ARAC|nr:hypothetical protein CDAR_609411 [Caerostris darwini]